MSKIKFKPLVDGFYFDLEYIIPYTDKKEYSNERIQITNQLLDWSKKNTKDVIFFAEFSSSKRPVHTDIENLLFYNIANALTFDALTKNGVIFTYKKNDKLPKEFRYTYQLKPKIIVFSKKEQILHLENIKFKIEGDYPGIYFKVIREHVLNQKINISDYSNYSSFKLVLEIKTKNKQQIHFYGRMKHMLDGIISAFHSFPEPSNDSLDKVYKRELELSKKFIDYNHWKSVMMNKSISFLGEHEFTKYNTKLLWLPKDDLFTEIQIFIDEDDSLILDNKEVLMSLSVYLGF